jgi:hypothetical protein
MITCIDFCILYTLFSNPLVDRLKKSIFYNFYIPALSLVIKYILFIAKDKYADFVLLVNITTCFLFAYKQRNHEFTIVFYGTKP